MTSAITPTKGLIEFQPKREVSLDPSDESQIRIVVTKAEKHVGWCYKNTQESRKIEKNVGQPLRKPNVLDVETHQEGNARHHRQQSDPLLRSWVTAGFSRVTDPKSPVTPLQYDIAPTTFSTSAMSTITMASQGQPSRKQPSGPLLRHFLHPMQRIGSI